MLHNIVIPAHSLNKPLLLCTVTMLGLTVVGFIHGQLAGEIQGTF